jgi:putative zinc finger/helix-turn-helix YgiT family protein
MASNLSCPVCEKGALRSESWDMEFEHAGQKAIAQGLEYSVCDTCGADPVLPEQARRNQVKISDARRQFDGLMSSYAIAEMRERFGLSQSEAAKLFGGGENAFSKYERGVVTQSQSMDKLMRVAQDVPGVMEHLWKLSGLESAKEPIDQQFAWTGDAVFVLEAYSPSETPAFASEGATVTSIMEWKKAREAA